MATITNRTINYQGRCEILEFLRENHRRSVGCPDYFNNEEMMRAWAEDAEFQMAEGNPPTIEIPSWYANCGYAVELRISDAGVNSEVIEVDDE